MARPSIVALVGNDQSTQPFADEAAADFAARSVLGMGRASRCGTSALDRTIYQYTSRGRQRSADRQASAARSPVFGPLARSIHAQECQREIAGG